MSDKDMVTVYERRDGSKPGLWSVYWYLGWDVFFSFSLAVGITSKNTMMVIVRECKSEDITEIDTFNELKAIDKLYVTG